MSTSKKQIAANKKNAQKSTGPKSDNGKTISSKNAVKHGLYSGELLLKSPYYNENPEEYQALVDSLIEEFQPETMLQHYLVYKIANALWRSRRVIIAEAAQVNNQLSHIKNSLNFENFIESVSSPPGEFDDDNTTADEIDEQTRKLNIQIGRNSIPNSLSSLNILRYEMRLDRQLTRAYNLLKHAQLYRTAENNIESIAPDIEND